MKRDDMDYEDENEHGGVEEQVSKTKQREENSNIRVIDALDFPKPQWNADRKVFNMYDDHCF
jgi:hypothetical protein